MESPYQRCGSPQGRGHWTRQSHIPLPVSLSGGAGGPKAGQDRLEHPVVVGYDGSSVQPQCARLRGGRGPAPRPSLLVVHVLTTGMYCEPLTGQVIGLPEPPVNLSSGLRAELTR